ncbi:MAG TPA: hypothetical protein VFG22_07655, partial [Polyangiales bacterium]|nr:hypothetical protein [Polyangiales bacterium]
VEGHVFSKLTGVPITSASVEVSAVGSNHEPWLIVGRALSDGNGFYSIRINAEDVDRAHLSIHASCLTEAGLKTTNRWTSPVDLRPNPQRRDLY